MVVEIPYKKEYGEQLFMDYVYDYFNGFDLDYEIKRNLCRVSLKRSNFLYCESFQDFFQKLGMDQSQANDFCYFGDKSSFFFSDAWFYYIYTSIINRKYSNNSRIVVIHIDDHSDMMDPFIGISENKFYNLINSKCVKLNDVEDARELITNGVVTIGSMLTPLMYFDYDTKIVHLSNESENKTYSIASKTINDGLMEWQIGRLHLEKVEAVDSTKQYSCIDVAKDMVQHIREDDFVILHFDMDYFNNRFNGSTEWDKGDGHHNPNMVEQMTKMNDIFNAVSLLVKKTAIVHTAIGVSPSFYPSEYWSLGVKYLLSGLASVGVDVSEVNNELKKMGWFL